MSKKFTLEDIQALAKAKGGECLSNEYLGSRALYLWRCREGHAWEALGKSLLSGHWCVKCSRSPGFQAFIDTASSHGGKCLTEKYTDCRDIYRWECSLGHVFEARADSVLGGSWCSVCVNRKKSMGIEKLFEMAKANGGECLSTKYKNKETKYKWRCSQGHEWEATGGSIKRGSWCCICNKGPPITLERLGELALCKKGTCLAVSCGKAMDKYSWKCARGHVWDATANSVQQGRWCPRCSHRISAPSVEIFNRLKQVYPDAESEVKGLMPGRKFIADIYIPSINTVVEYDGYRFHKSPWAIKNGAGKRDIEKESLLRGLGMNVYHIDEGKYTLKGARHISPTPEILDQMVSDIVATIRACPPQS
jgi:hypothetical protein